MALKYDPERHSRHSTRLPGYDYAQPGAYFVTVCTQHRECLFGEIVKGKIALNEAGKMVKTVWDELPRHYPGADVDGFVVMPNHIHGIIVLITVGAGPCACPSDRHACQNDGRPRGAAPTMSLMDVVHRFKSLTTARYRHYVVEKNWQPFPGRLWQRNYYEHIVRDENELNYIRQYILDNPMRWEMDRENPQRRPEDESEEWFDS
jgi:REP element-mobilizing transposase RayT